MGELKTKLNTCSAVFLLQSIADLKLVLVHFQLLADARKQYGNQSMLLSLWLDWNKRVGSKTSVQKVSMFGLKQKHFRVSEKRTLLSQRIFSGPRTAKLGNVCLLNNVSWCRQAVNSECVIECFHMKSRHPYR